MPELPEVETVARSLAPQISGRRVLAARSSGKRLRCEVDLGAIRAHLIGRRLGSIRRQGKYLLLEVESSSTLVVHLGMSGRLLCVEAAAPDAKHTHLALALEGGRELRFVDPRRFGLVRVCRSEELSSLAELAELGPDPLGPGFSVERFGEALGRTRRDLKSVLLDQHVAAGLGNIYAAEALYEARLPPGMRGDRLDAAMIARLHAAIRCVLERGVANRGTTLRDYVDGEGRGGDNQHALRVYGREGLPCPRCGRRISRLVQGQRSTFYCPSCQPTPRRSRRRSQGRLMR